MKLIAPSVIKVSVYENEFVCVVSHFKNKNYTDI